MARDPKALPPSLDTLLARGGAPHDPATGAVTPPIHLATTYARDAAYRLPSARLYARDDNATAEPAETLLAQLEGGAAALMFSSGMAAAAAVFHTLRPEDHVVAPRIMYWALRGWLTEFCDRWGVDLDLVDTHDLDALRAAVRPGRTRLVWLETPANPTWDVTDITGAAEIARAAGARLVVDSTAATPIHSQPLALGADIVMHSATKYLNGHSDVIAGALVTETVDDQWMQIRLQRRSGGAVLGPFDAWLVHRGMRTLAVRVRRQSASALRVAEAMVGHPGLEDVLYPGLPSHPQHAVAARQMQGGFGGMLSLRVAGGAATALRMVSRLRLFARATSLGGVESLIEHRASVEPPDSPVPKDLLRVSIGLEDPDELIADLRAALE